MTLAEIHYNFKLALDRLSTASKRDLNAAEIDAYLTQAQKIYIDSHLRKSSSNTTIPVALAPLATRSTIPVQSVSSTEYTANLPSDLRHVITLHAIASCGRVPLKYADYEDIATILEDPFNKPSKVNFPYTIDNQGVRFYTPDDLTVTELDLFYIKEPARVNLGSYVYLDGIQHPLQNLQVGQAAHPEIIQLAVTLASLDLEGGQNQSGKLGLYNE